MARKRRARVAALEWQTVVDDEDENFSQASRPNIRIKHTHVDLDTAGPSSRRTAFISGPASPQKRTNDNTSVHEWVDNPPPGYDLEQPIEEDLDPAYVHHLDDFEIIPRRRKRTVEDNPLKKWRDSDRDMFLHELLRLDGRAGICEPAVDGHEKMCTKCSVVPPTIRCEDCYGGQLYCTACTVQIHRSNPFHRIERWNGLFFETTTLKSIGLRIQLGHPHNEWCPNPQAAAGDAFVVIDHTGVHEIGLDYCRCGEAVDLSCQLLRARLYPATVQAPKTAATFNVLEFFHLLTFESKTSVFEFFRTLSRRTDNTGVLKVPDRYSEFLRMIREWRHLKMLKRAGRGHDPDGVKATKEGECAVLCPACPQPGKNLPPDWRDKPAAISWLFAFFQGGDANFRMIRLKVSSEMADPTLSPGWSYFVETTKYNEHLAKYGDQKDVRSTCVKHHAVSDANTGRYSNLASSGIGTMDCIRHDVKRANAVGCLQKGEKYVNMDYLFFSSLSQKDYTTIVMSYDIVCQWSVHVWERMSAFPQHFHMDHGVKKITFLVPKFHLPAHVAACQTAFSFNLTRGVGRTDGEAPERGWAAINPVSAQTKQMGPASHRETIDDHFGDWNHKKVISFGTSLLRKLKNAVPSRAEHVADFYQFSDSIPASSILEWTVFVERWEQNNCEVNPFVPTVKTITQHGVRLALADEDMANLLKDDAEPIHDDMSPSMLVSAGLDLELQQSRLKLDIIHLDGSATTLQLAKIQERKNSLQRKIKVWTAVQHLYMPEVAALRAREDSNASTEIQSYEFALYLPSSLPRRTSCTRKLRDYEFKLREAQAYESLDELRQHLRLRTHMYKYKDKNVVGQRASTRCQNLINRVQRKVNTSATKYNSARRALEALSTYVGDGQWRTKLLPLAPEDIRSLRDEEHDMEMQKKKKKDRDKKAADGTPKVAEGHKVLSWIWKVVGVAGDSEDRGVQEALRIEWCRVRARAMRWSEEVLLLREEMRRVLKFLEWHASWWDSQCARHTDLSPELMEGMMAYAKKQASIRTEIRQSFNLMWRESSELISMGVGADNEILDLGLAATSDLLEPPALELLSPGGAGADIPIPSSQEPLLSGGIESDVQGPL